MDTTLVKRTGTPPDRGAILRTENVPTTDTAARGRKNEQAGLAAPTEQRIPPEKGSADISAAAPENPALSEGNSLERHTRHVRAPALRRRGNVIVMSAAAALGAACGAISLCRTAETPEVSLLFSSIGEESYLALFLDRLIRSSAFLLAEYFLGFFAFGECLVWCVPILCGMGAGASAALAFRTVGISAAALLLPSAAALAATAFAANTSGELSALLLRLASGGRGGAPSGMIMTGSAAGGYTISFLAYFAVLIAAALCDAAIRLSLK